MHARTVKNAGIVAKSMLKSGMKKLFTCNRTLHFSQGEDLSREEEDEILDKMNEINFNLHTLEIRLNRHKELVPKRYKALLANLEKHQQLSVLQKQST